MILSLGPETRAEVWNYLDWSSSVPKLGAALVANEDIDPTEKAALLRELAELCEFCVLDPQSAADLYSASYQSDRSQLDVLSRMRRLCHSMGRSDHAARTAELEFRHSQNPRYHAVAGQAWLDAGQPDRAVGPLLRAEEATPGEQNIAAALEVARRDWANPEDQASMLLSRARQSSVDAPIMGLQAARIWRMLNIEDERYEESLQLCLDTNPNMLSPCNLMEHLLFSTGRLDDLAAHFQRRSQAAPNKYTAARILFLGSSLLFRADAGDEGGPLFVEGLRLAIDTRLRSIPGLLAQLRGLVASAATERKQVVELADKAFSILQSEDEKMGVAIFCAQIAWKAQRNREKAETWLRRIKAYSDDHSLLSDFGAI
jgi:tetratricopeptide (TPR) repeat protein